MTAARAAMAMCAEESPDEFLDWVLRLDGLDPGGYRRQPLRRRLPACLRALRVSTIDQARALLADHPDRLVSAISALLVGVTEFFRYPEMFEAIETDVLPELATRGTEIRIWSAACSSGEELYTMAILLAESGQLEASYLLGTDCRGDAIDKARNGGYHPNALRQMDPQISSRYLEQIGGRWYPIPRLRQNTHWKTADFCTEVEDGPWDIIFWQNMAIYLEPHTSYRLWQDLVRVLRPGGVLVVGPAERAPAGLPLLCIGRHIYRHTGDPANAQP